MLDIILKSLTEPLTYSVDGTDYIGLAFKNSAQNGRARPFDERNYFWDTSNKNVRLGEAICSLGGISSEVIQRAYKGNLLFIYFFSCRYEIRRIMATSYIKGVLLSSIMITTRVAIYACLVAYVLLGYEVTARRVFVLTSFYNVLRHTMTALFPQGIAQVSEASVSIKRLNKFLTYEERDLKKANQGESERGKGIFLRNVTAKWNANSPDNTLTNVSLTAKPRQLLAIIGPVGSGKSSLFQAILQELPLKAGTVEVTGKISYASQEPWLFAGSVRQNILFGLPMDEERYRRVIKVCSLERDFGLLPYGDNTVVGDRGVSLSGGQRARVNLARAIYKDADVYLLDDPLSAVDTHVGRELFVNCIAGFLKEKTCILITHQLQYLKDVDHIIILEEGIVQAEGLQNNIKNPGSFKSIMLCFANRHLQTTSKFWS